MSALDLATGQTLAFLDEVFPAPPARVLDVGCGAGHVAAGLLARGYEVVAIDPSEEAVATARGHGVPARVASFPDIDQPAFDVVFFGRSLHHVTGLPRVYRRVVELLAPGGRMVVEDWRWDGMDRVTATWTYGLVGMAVAAGLFDASDWELDGDPLETWMEGHRDHHIYTEADMIDGAAGHFEVIDERRVPYIYRYFCTDLDHDPRGLAIATRVFGTEKALVAMGTLQPMGMRFVGTPLP